MRLCALSIAPLVFALLAPTVAASEFSVHVEPLACEASDALESELRARLESEFLDAQLLSVTIGRREDGSLHVRLVTARGTFVRQLHLAPAECAALPLAVSLLARASLERSWSDSAPSPEVLQHVEDSGTAPKNEGAPPPAPSPRLSLGAQLGSSTSLWLSEPLFSLSGTADASLSSSLGLAAAAKLEPGLAIALPPGTIRAAISTLSLSLRWTFARGELGALSLAAGPAISAVSARSTGYTENERRTRAAPGWVAALRWHSSFAPVPSRWSKLSRVVSLSIEGMGRSDWFELRGLETAVELRPIRLALELGLSFDVL